MVEGFSPFGRPFEKLHRSVHRDAFLVTRDHERDRSFWPPAVCGDVIERRGQRTGDRPLHVNGAAAVERAVGDLAGKRRVRPFRLVTWRHHIDVAGESKVRACRADARIEVFNGHGPGLCERNAMHSKSCRFEHAFDHAERAGFRRCHRRAAQEIAGEGGGICVWRAHRGGYAPSWAASRLFWFLTQPGIRNASTSTQTIVITAPTMASVSKS